MRTKWISLWPAPRSSGPALTAPTWSLSSGEPTDDRLAGFDWRAGSDSPNNKNIVIFRNDTANDPIDRWLLSLDALAITTVTFEPSSGRLLNADIELNDVPARKFSACDNCTVAFDLQNTLTHELGHVLGLDHPPSDQPDAAQSTMFKASSRGDLEKRDLAQDDIDGLCFVYPTGAPPEECTGDGWHEPPDVRFVASLCAGGTARVGVRRCVPCLCAAVEREPASAPKIAYFPRSCPPRRACPSTAVRSFSRSTTSCVLSSG